MNISSSLYINKQLYIEQSIEQETEKAEENASTSVLLGEKPDLYSG